VASLGLWGGRGAAWLRQTGTTRTTGKLLASPTVHLEPYVASLSKHDIAGIVLAVVAAIAVVWGGVRFSARAAEASVFLIGAVVLAVVALLLFTRTI
jgi:hypothetical protein